MRDGIRNLRWKSPPQHKNNEMSSNIGGEKKRYIWWVLMVGIHIKMRKLGRSTLKLVSSRNKCTEAPIRTQNTMLRKTNTITSTNKEQERKEEKNLCPEFGANVYRYFFPRPVSWCAAHGLRLKRQWKEWSNYFPVPRHFSILFLTQMYINLPLSNIGMKWEKRFVFWQLIQCSRNDKNILLRNRERATKARDAKRERKSRN